MLAAGQREGAIIIIAAAILILFALLAVFIWVKKPRPEPTPRPVTPSGAQWRAPRAPVGGAEYDLHAAVATYWPESREASASTNSDLVFRRQA